jgi:hypothetical protein
MAVTVDINLSVVISFTVLESKNIEDSKEGN